ncbi:MAG TPA: hypothetical protein DCX32_01280 [Candidatus Moranbacteria bacterium]|nr:MAG: hypothetical protein UW87_C0020G0001 [Candidatus Moranbacteria bacterium GW2011_GWC2_45_10]KKT94824.1 MAG: hypothetical protein UW95_C0008G0033 [Parcubacteria group bacterium GW2011_GWC1_45_14]HAV11160.1 hypothetical protein [Candidatus Moranbacteria bacterium]
MSFDLKKARTVNAGGEVRETEKRMPREEFEESDTSEDRYLESISWRAPEYEIYEKSATWYSVAALIFLAIAAYAMWTNSPIMAITFILIGVVGYIYLQKDPRMLDFSISHMGVQAGDEMYEFENMESFWIFYDPPHTKTLSLHTKASFMPFVHIPLADEDPAVVREVMMRFLSEEKQEAGFVDALERFLHI